MKLFLDSSTILAACCGRRGASRFICDVALSRGWTLVISDYVVAEVEANLVDMGVDAAATWRQLRAQLQAVRDEFTYGRPTVFLVPKDKPILFTAAVHADVLLTLDDHDFGRLLGDSFYSLRILTPGAFLISQR